MSKSHFDNTEIDNLTGNLRGEIGEIIQSWTLMRELIFEIKKLSSNDFMIDSQNNQLSKLRLLKKNAKMKLLQHYQSWERKNIVELIFTLQLQSLKLIKTKLMILKVF